MSSLPMPEAPTPNNNVLQIDSTDSLGARPKTLSKASSRTLSMRPTSSIDLTLKSRQTGQGVDISASHTSKSLSAVKKKIP